ncbi:hypothetical protein EV672_10960 [Aquabacterium commune]|uniref:Uncharacterized protein n=1 Tax=Aquabacterium commune TaxID=70586 RepID=A0A4R6R558_9BURK|nr:hypothetical protein EV672_10960 [Aquabacterium commune]
MAVQAVSSRGAGIATEAAADASWQASLGQQLQRQWHRLQARLRSTWRPLTVALLAPPHVPGDALAVDAALDAFDAWAAEHEGVNVAVQLSSRWLLCCATPEAANGAQARELAQQQWAHYFGLEAEQLNAEWLTVDALQGGAKTAALGDVRLVCAVPRALIDGLKDVARERGLQLQAAMPWWAEGLQDSLDADAVAVPAAAQPEGSTRAWAWAEPGLLNQAQAEAREGRWVLTRVWSELASDVRAEPGRTPEAVAAMAPPEPGALAWPLSPAPRRHEGWAEGLNFLGPRVRTSFWGWALLALGVVAALHAADRAAAVQDELTEAQAVVKRLQRGERQVSVQAQAASVAQATQAASAPELQAESWRHAAQLAQWLGFPWADTLDHIDATSLKHKAVLAQFSLDLATLASNEGVQPDLKLQAAVIDDTAALQWLAALGPQAMLRAREPLNTPFLTAQGRYAWRLDVVTTGGTP